MSVRRPLAPSGGSISVSLQSAHSFCYDVRMFLDGHAARSRLCETPQWERPQEFDQTFPDENDYRATFQGSRTDLSQGRCVVS
jgi:hypothetical protein